MASKIFVVVFLSVFAVSHGKVASPLTSSDYAVQTRAIGKTESKVKISVGMKPDFLYTANGHTYSNQKVAVSGEYLNDEIHNVGYAYLFAVVESGINRYNIFPDQNTLRIDIWNGYGDLFEFQILVPYPVLVARDVRSWVFNDTSIIVNGPSRSYFYPNQKSTNIAGKSYNLEHAPPAA